MRRRTFIKNASILSVAFPLANKDLGDFGKKTSLSDRLWLWGHNAGGHHHPVNAYNLPGDNRLGPMEACDYLGIRKCCRVALGEHGPFPPFDHEAEKLKSLKEVVWSAVGDASSKQHDGEESDLGEILRIAKYHDNITGAILDDFFIVPTADGRVARYTLQSIEDMRNRLHGFQKRHLVLWLVWYIHQLDYELADYIKLFDVLTMWEWKGSNLKDLDHNIEKFVNKTPGKRRLMGCYLWNFGEKMPMTVDQMAHQLEVCHRWIKRGDIEGIVFCANTVVDIGLESVEFTRNWISKHGRTLV
ncbi:hypothetical protein [Parapedobacter indicus]|uniref:hypothetical protein n=1 Tax=Parapedobacter indicus TaxID=1477437 RepID=UPI0011604C9D|nr:hypothetical protein [Parapedobacter indicus]